jgi:2-polyprenyl-6-methoxyphenol hydroxylase-like FAD-dependent oxidoreductase
MRDPTAVLERMSPGFDATFRAITSATTDLRFDELVDRDPIPFWSKGLVTLVGDAAHPMLPHTGQGAAQAMVDAVALAAALEQPIGIEEALRSYEGDRLAKTATLVNQGRRTARIMRTTNPIACSIREAVVRMIPIKTVVKFYARVNRRAGTEVSDHAR